MNLFTVTGRVRQVQLSDKDRPTALVLVQYGPHRERQGRAVEFVNAVLVRVPAYRLEKIPAGVVEEGAMVEVTGRIQGVLKGLMNEGFFSTELVADRVHPVIDPDAGDEDEEEEEGEEAASEE